MKYKYACLILKFEKWQKCSELETVWGPESFDIIETFSRMTIHQPSPALASLAVQKTSNPVKITQETLSSLVAGSGSVTDFEKSEDALCVGIKKKED